MIHAVRGDATRNLTHFAQSSKMEIVIASTAFSFWLSGTLALNPERQVHEVKN